MRRRISLPSAIETMDWPGYRWLLVELDRESVPLLCLDLCLLDRDLTEALVITGSPVTVSIEIRKIPPRTDNLRTGSTARGRVRWNDAKVMLDISGDELDCWIRFFLEYHRDGFGPVDHVDVEVPSGSPEDARSLHLTLKVPEALPPMSAEEARRKLGIRPRRRTR